MLVCIVFHLGVLDEKLVLMVLIMMRVFLQRCRIFQMRSQSIIGVDSFEWM